MAFIAIFHGVPDRVAGGNTFSALAGQSAPNALPEAWLLPILHRRPDWFWEVLSDVTPPQD
jgi:hypothetical protein